jgi:hypothetical protein
MPVSIDTNTPGSRQPGRPGEAKMAQAVDLAVTVIEIAEVCGPRIKVANVARGNTKTASNVTFTRCA